MGMKGVCCLELEFFLLPKCSFCLLLSLEVIKKHQEADKLALVNIQKVIREVLGYSTCVVWTGKNAVDVNTKNCIGMKQS